ncbi:MAG: response regulator, partial [Nitrospira sp.]|nr:response regulator [Nitrospira sp.]
YFPRHAEDSKGEAAESRSDATLLVGSETILLVEDDNEVRHILADVLRGAGYTVLQADNGVNALQFTTRYVGPIDLMVTDIMMRQMNGRVLAQQMRVSRPETKVLYMSGYEDNAIVRQGVLVERTPFLAKPFSLDALLKKVREVLDLPQESGS